jgi:hypothetical protein
MLQARRTALVSAKSEAAVAYCGFRCPTQRLHQELQGRGYQGSLGTLRRVTAQMRQDTAVPAAPAARRAASWILTPPADLADDDRAALARITARGPELKATRDLVHGFADMLCRRRGERLEAWAAQAEASEVSELRSFAAGLRRAWGRHRRAHTALQLRRHRRPRQPHQDDQTTNVRPGETRPAPQARPARRLTRSRKVRQSHFPHGHGQRR